MYGYIDRAGLEQRFGPDEIAQLLGEDYPPAPGSERPAPSIVQSNEEFESSSPLAVGLSAVPAGNVLLLFVRCEAFVALAAPPTVTDSNEGTWTLRGTANRAATEPIVYVFSASVEETGDIGVNLTTPLVGDIHALLVEITGTSEAAIDSVAYSTGATNPAVPFGVLPDRRLAIAAVSSINDDALTQSLPFTALDAYAGIGALAVGVLRPPVGDINAQWLCVGPWIALAVEIAPDAEAFVDADPEQLREAIDDAEGLINGYLSVRYELPLEFVPTLLTNWAADIARFKLWDNKASAEVRQRYEDVLKQLEQFAKGLIDFPLGEFTSAILVPTVYRTFTRTTLAGFVGGNTGGVGRKSSALEF